MTFRVTGSKIAVIPLEDPPKIGLIHVPEISRQRSDQGIVAFIGPDARDFYPGQYVIFSGHSGTVVYIQDPTRPEEAPKKYILLEERFVFGEIIDFEDCFIPGVYFKSKDRTDELVDAIFSVIDNNSAWINRDEIAAFKQEVNNLILWWERKKYIEATYDITIDFLAQALRSAEWRKFNPVTGKGIDVQTKPPTQEEINVGIK